ncbi:DUF3093 family protein [Gordonia sp. HNM0687]|uniref:DUF3093 family protein n=1 Tax=Gordonia mangrovi TaxID=2665643 RepID=A0A6L7GQX0_9ACTN|nr:DUF3093 domain-containing protein [Gordonia mangrovi]MXP22339.1 DUF3093 family protein [Gordonia mangrovi]UVF77769.1 DUF3093 domain-containing protein [Gordonia mangrovi]
MTPPESPENPAGRPSGDGAGGSTGDAKHPATERNSTPDRFSERLTVPWWWWLAAAVVTGVVGYEIQLSAHRSAWSIVGYVVVAVLCAAVLWSMGRVSIRVTADRELQAGRARLPRAVIARGATVPATAKSAALGRQLDPAAFLMHRAWVKTMVLLVLDDPDDPTPYWLVSTRRPAALLAALDLPDAAAEAGIAD